MISYRHILYLPKRMLLVITRQSDHLRGNLGPGRDQMKLKNEISAHGRLTYTLLYEVQERIFGNDVLETIR